MVKLGLRLGSVSFKHSSLPCSYRSPAQWFRAQPAGVQVLALRLTEICDLRQVTYPLLCASSPRLKTGCDGFVGTIQCPVIGTALTLVSEKQ